MLLEVALAFRVNGVCDVGALNAEVNGVLCTEV